MSTTEQIVHTVLRIRGRRIGREPSQADVAEVMESLAHSTNKPPYGSPDQMVAAIEAAIRKYEESPARQNFPPEID